jgi:hypothetical protein
MGLQILTAAWGQKHVEWFIRGCLKSLGQTKNRRAIQETDTTWNVFTDAEYIGLLKQEIEMKFPAIFKVNPMPIELLRDRTDNLLSATIWQIGKCLETKQPMLLAPPDTLFGDGSVEGLMRIGAEPNVCVTVAHPRVLPEILGQDIGDTEKFVNLAWSNLHRSWSEAERGHPRQNSFIGGVDWQKTKEKPMTIAVRHRLPTPYYCNFTPEDEQFFRVQIGFGTYDHTWAAMLYQMGRIRHVGSSDIAFICELTDADKNIPPVHRGGNPMEFWKRDAHNEINKQIITVFRGQYETEGVCV